MGIGLDHNEDHTSRAFSKICDVSEPGFWVALGLIKLTIPAAAFAQSTVPTTLVGVKGECQKVSLAGIQSNCAPGAGVLYSVLPNGRALITFPLADGRVASFVGEKGSQPSPASYYLYLSRVRILSKGTEFTANVAGLCVISMSRDGKIWSDIGCQATDENSESYELKFRSNGDIIDVQHPAAKNTAGPAPAAHVDTKTIARVTARFQAALRQTGVSGVARDIGKCFDDSRSNIPAIRSCMLYDLAAMSLDKSMRKIFESRGVDPGAQDLFLSDLAFGARMDIYAGMAFGGSAAAAYQFFGDAPNVVTNGISK